jgi:penicillin-binding protein 1A
MFDRLFARQGLVPETSPDWAGDEDWPSVADVQPAPRPGRWRRRWVWAKRVFWAGLILFLALFVWLAFTAPLSKSLEPIAPPRLTVLAADGQPIARNGANIDDPVEAAKLPLHVKQAFLAIEDRRFYSHWGVDPRGLARAAINNMGDGGTQGGSTITQQLAKITFLTPERSLTRKAREMLIAFWLEAWLTKDEVLERYLSNVYFGDNAYGLRAASLHYFNRQPERLTLSQAAMLAGLVQAPSRLAPTRNPDGARRRARMVLDAMADAGFISEARARTTPAARLDVRPRKGPPTGTYFADWAIPQARALAEDAYGEESIRTTLDTRLQRIARNVVGGAALGGAQVALVAMRPNGEVVAMIGGRSYDKSPFNRATQARRQPGSTFKLFVYLAALRAGMTPDSMIDDSAITDGSYRPKNAAETYRGEITLREAFARSSNVAAVRLYRQLGDRAVMQAARDMGIDSPLAADPTLALGSSGVTLLELTAAYAGVAAQRYPVEPHAIAEDEPGFFDRLLGPQRRMDGRTHKYLLEMMKATIEGGTGRAARLAIPAYGKTGTSQDNRDALFVGFAGDLVVGVWVGNDDNTPLRGVNGGGLPARIWRNFMAQAVRGAAPVEAPKPVPLPDLPLGNDTIPALPPVNVTDADIDLGENPGVTLKGDIGGVNVDLKIDRDGVDIDAQPPPRR